MRATAPSDVAAISIGELSRRSGVNIETIRYYERIGMMPHPPRTASGRRVYGPTETGTLAFIRRARELGFTLDEIRALLALAAEGGHQAASRFETLRPDISLTYGQRSQTWKRWKASSPTPCIAATRANRPIVH
jgi:DNA-binding transcriptional MerR regulator